MGFPHSRCFLCLEQEEEWAQLLWKLARSVVLLLLQLPGTLSRPGFICMSVPTAVMFSLEGALLAPTLKQKKHS